MGRVGLSAAKALQETQLQVIIDAAKHIPGFGMFLLQTPGLLGKASAEPALNTKFIDTLKTNYLRMDFF